MRVVTVIGNRPQFVKAAAVSRLLRAAHEELPVHTGQHYDDELSPVFFDELGVPRAGAPARHRRRHEHRRRRRACSPRSEPLLAERARRGARLRRHELDARRRRSRPRRRGVPVAHVEAGMRSFDRAMPEELNRVLTDHLADAAAVPVADGGRQPRARAVAGARRARRRRDGRRRAARRSPRARARRRAAARRPASRPAATCWRPRTAPATSTIPSACARSSTCCSRCRWPTVLPLHPRTRARLEAAGLLDELERAEHVRLRAAARLPRRSPRCCRARARSSPTPAACRRRPTSPACRA